MQHIDPVTIVEDWQAAANSQQIERLLALSAPDIEIVGPRGTARGREVLRDWLQRAGLHLTTQRIFARGDTVVIAQRGVWRSPETGAIAGEQDIASRFRVTAGQITHLARHDRLDAALAEAGLTESDEISSQ